MSLVPHPSDADTLFAGGHGLGVVKSTDGGRTWTRSDEGIDGTDIHALAINQRQPDYVFAYSTGHGVYRSSDGGTTWDRLDDGPHNPGVRSFAYMAVQTDMDRSMGSDNWGLLFAGTADGIYDSYSCFCGWRETTDRFDGSTVYAVATNHADPRTMYAGTTEGMWKSTDEGKTWAHLDGVTGRVAAISIILRIPEPSWPSRRAAPPSQPPTAAANGRSATRTTHRGPAVITPRGCCPAPLWRHDRQQVMWTMTSGQVAQCPERPAAAGGPMTGRLTWSARDARLPVGYQR